MGLYARSIASAVDVACDVLLSLDDDELFRLASELTTRDVRQAENLARGLKQFRHALTVNVPRGTGTIAYSIYSDEQIKHDKKLTVDTRIDNLRLPSRIDTFCMMKSIYTIGRLVSRGRRKALLENPCEVGRLTITDLDRFMFVNDYQPWLIQIPAGEPYSVL